MNERLQEMARTFFDKVLEIVPNHSQADFVVVTHLLEDRPWFLRAVAQLGSVTAVIPKPKSINPSIRDLLRHEFQLRELSRSELGTLDGIRSQLRPLAQSRPLCLLDIGGYFETTSRYSNRDLGFELAGIVEDTENGHVKYLALAESGLLAAPVYSVARSELKRPENYLVGQSLVFSTEALLRQRDELLHGRRVCVIGYGNIGRSVAIHLHEKRSNVTVFDIDPVKLVEAFTHGFSTPPSLEEAYKDADIVFCVTGNGSLGLHDFQKLRPFTYVATVTSPDDELRMDELKDHYDVHHIDEYITEYRSSCKTLYLLNRGQAVNFIHGSVVGPFIQLLQAEILVAAGRLLSGGYADGVQSVSFEDKRRIASAWLEVYGH